VGSGRWTGLSLREVNACAQVPPGRRDLHDSSPPTRGEGFGARTATVAMQKVGFRIGSYPVNREKASVMFWPPKPKLLESAWSQRDSRDWFGT